LFNLLIVTPDESPEDTSSLQLALTDPDPLVVHPVEDDPDPEPDPA
jgi:hypothetical protein